MPSEERHLSILIPTYNDICVDIVAELSKQAELLPGLTYEILVADDGSTMADKVASNQAIEQLPRCRYLKREHNVGRSAIRNYLAREAQYELLLFIDSHMSVIREDYLAQYLTHHQLPLVYGGYALDANHQPAGNLRCLYEVSCIDVQDVRKRAESPYSNFHTSNFMVHRDVMLSHPFDERFKRYGYEDVLFGKQLQEAGIPITHIDNPVGFDRFESNQRFVEKTEEGLCTLYEFKDELKGYSRLLTLYDRLSKWHLLMPLKWFYSCFGRKMRNHLLSTRPSLFLFKVYRLSYFISLKR